MTPQINKSEKAERASHSSDKYRHDAVFLFVELLDVLVLIVLSVRCRGLVQEALFAGCCSCFVLTFGCADMQPGGLVMENWRLTESFRDGDSEFGSGILCCVAEWR